MINTHSDWLHLIDKVTEYYPPSSDPMSFQVTIKKTRSRYGRVDVLVKPVNGTGERWVELNTSNFGAWATQQEAKV